MRAVHLRWHIEEFIRADFEKQTASSVDERFGMARQPEGGDYMRLSVTRVFERKSILQFAQATWLERAFLVHMRTYAAENPARRGVYCCLTIRVFYGVSTSFALWSTGGESSTMAVTQAVGSQWFCARATYLVSRCNAGAQPQIIIIWLGGATRCHRSLTQGGKMRNAM